MSLFDRFFRSRRSKAGPIDLAALLDCLRAELPQVAGEVDPLRVHSRFADRCRDAGLKPLGPHELQAHTTALDADGWRRLALAVAALDRPDVRAALPAQRSLPKLFADAFLGLAAENPRLTYDLIASSPLRLEELARQLVLRLGATVEGESEDAFRQRLERLDYGAVMHDAERARLATEEHLDYLRRLEDEQESLRPRRGKW